MEEEIIVAHLVDTRAFEHCSVSKGATEIHPRDTFPVRVKTDKNQYSLSRRFVYDVLYGFETVDSCVQGLIDFAHKIENSIPFNVKEVPLEKPVVHHVESLAEAQRLVESGISDKNVLVSMPTSLFEKLQNKPGGLLDNAESGVLIANETQGDYALSNLRTLEEELKNALTGEINPTLESDKGD